MRKLNLLLTLTIGAIVSYGQAIPEDAIDKLKPSHYQTKAILTLVPGMLDMGAAGNLVYGYGLNADGFIGNRFSVAGGLTAAYNDTMFKNGNDSFHSDSYQGINKSNAKFLSVGLHLVDKIGMGRIRFEKYKGRRTTWEGKVYDMYDVYKKKGPVRKILAVRAGLYSWKSGITTDGSADEWFVMSPGTGTLTQINDRTYTNLITSNLSLGIALSKFVSGSDLGPAGIVSYFRNFYVDVLFNTKTSLDDTKDALGNSYTYQVGQGSLEESKTGWRAGWKTIGLARKYWVGGYYLEGGVRPGIKGRGPFLQMGLILGTKYPLIPLNKK